LPKKNAVLSILERLPQTAVISSAQTGRILWVNSRDINVMRATHPEQLVGRVLLEFIDPAQQATALRDLEAISRGESPPPVIYKLKRLDGGWAWVQIASIPMVFEGGPAMLSLVADVSEQQEALRELEESEQRYRELVQAAPDGIIVVVGDDIAYVNPAAAALVNCPDADALIGRSMYDFIRQDERAGIREARRQLLTKSARLFDAPATLVTLDGAEVPVTARTAFVYWHGEPATQTVLRLR
jgi:PAS domain S-box-containing protein